MAEAAARGVGAARPASAWRCPTATGVATGRPDARTGAVRRSLDVAYQGGRVGAIAVAKPPDEPLTPGRGAAPRGPRRPGGSGPAQRPADRGARDPAGELAVQAEGLRVSRERLVTARDAQRRGLERDIREGPGATAARDPREPRRRRRCAETRPPPRSASTRSRRARTRPWRDCATSREGSSRRSWRTRASCRRWRRTSARWARTPTSSATPGFDRRRFDADTEPASTSAASRRSRTSSGTRQRRARARSTWTTGLRRSAASRDRRGAGFDPATTARGMGMRDHAGSGRRAGRRSRTSTSARAAAPRCGSDSRPSSSIGCPHDDTNGEDHLPQPHRRRDRRGRGGPRALVSLAVVRSRAGSWWSGDPSVGDGPQVLDDLRARQPRATTLLGDHVSPGSRSGLRSASCGSSPAA